jgi:hypothetical protein
VLNIDVLPDEHPQRQEDAWIIWQTDEDGGRLSNLSLGPPIAWQPISVTSRAEPAPDRWRAVSETEPHPFDAFLEGDRPVTVEARWINGQWTLSQRMKRKRRIDEEGEIIGWDDVNGWDTWVAHVTGGILWNGFPETEGEFPIAWRPRRFLDYWIFLDDEREAPNSDERRLDRLWNVDSFEAWWRLIEEQGCPSFVSFDCDLGRRPTVEQRIAAYTNSSLDEKAALELIDPTDLERAGEVAPDGLACATWLADWLSKDPSQWKPRFQFEVHSGDAAQREAIASVLRAVIKEVADLQE